jgi:hypothetical protein
MMLLHFKKRFAVSLGAFFVFNFIFITQTPYGVIFQGDIESVPVETQSSPARSSQSFREIESDISMKSLSKPEIQVAEPLLSLEQIAQEVVEGKWGEGEDLEEKLKDAGYDFELIQIEIENIKASQIEDKIATPDPIPKPAPKPEPKAEPKPAEKTPDPIVTTPEPVVEVEQPKVETPPAAPPVVEAPKPPAYVVNLAEGTRYVTSSLNVRKGPGTDYSVVKNLSKGTEVNLVGAVDNGWYQIKDGFVSGKYLSESKPVVEAPKPAPSTSLQANSVYINGSVMKYKISNYTNMQRDIDNYKRTWITAGDYPNWSPTDGRGTFFGEHNYEGADILMKLSNGSKIVITDSNGTPYTYVVEKIYRKNQITHFTDEIGGRLKKEYVIFQTCEYSTGNIHVIANLVN